MSTYSLNYPNALGDLDMVRFEVGDTSETLFLRNGALINYILF